MYFPSTPFHHIIVNRCFNSFLKLGKQVHSRGWGEKKCTDKLPFYNYFKPNFRLLHEYLSQNWSSEGHFEGLCVSISKLDQKLQHNISQNHFFSCLKVYYFMAILPKWILAPPKETSSHVFKMPLFPKLFRAFMRQIVR